MAAGATTGTYSFGSMYASDMVLEVFERLGWRTASLTQEMLLSAQRSFNFVQARWSNLGVNLWEVSLQQLPLVNGQATYVLPANTISILPAAFVRTSPLSNSVSATPAFTVTTGSNVVTVTQANAGAPVGAIINVATPIAIGGIVLYGYYTVVSTPTSTTYTFLAADTATSNVSGGTLPTLTSDGTTSEIVVALTNQPFVVGQSFNVPVSTTVGKVTIQGLYPIVAIGVNSFTINVSTPTSTVQTVTLNAGKAIIQYAPPNATPVDRVLYPLGRDDYTSIAVKSQQAPPTSYWFDRLSDPQVTLWPVPDTNGPYQLNYYALSQIQDAAIGGGVTLDIPYRFMEAYAAACAAHLAMKWRQDIAPALLQYAQQVWVEASDADREKVPFYAAPCLDGYYR